MVHVKQFNFEAFQIYYIGSILTIYMFLNNIFETFNTYIKMARDKVIVTVLEIIRRQLMRRMHVKKDRMREYSQLICPRIMQKLEFSMNYA